MRTIETHSSAQRPNGAPFIIDRCRFKYGEHIDVTMLDLEEDKVQNWPMVYILANSDTAYVGQTTSIATRIDQHSANEERRDFEVVNIIFNEEFNSSVVTDYEHRLIGLMDADTHFTLTNKNAGMTDSNYFSKAAYNEMFETLWEELRRLELADQTIAEIEETEIFKYSPFKNLTPDQRLALDDIMRVINEDNNLSEAKPIVIEGMPGTGKTVLAIYLLKMLKDDPKYKDLNIKIIEPVTSLKKTLQNALRNVSGLSPSDIIGPADLVKPARGYRPNEKGFDILLVDESHKLKRRVNLGTQFGNYDNVNRTLGLSQEATQMDWVINQAKLPIFFYDPLQSIGPACLKPEQIKRSLGKATERPITLGSQMRVKGGRVYLDYIKAIMADETPKEQSFTDYEFMLHDDFEDFILSFNDKFAEHDLSRMIAGYAWKWRSKNETRTPQNYDIEIDNIGLYWNCTYDNWVGKGFNDSKIAHEVGCIHSIQGYDLSYAYVIIGNDLEIDPKTGKLRANRDNYFDRNGSATASDEELTQYIKNIYYVLLTRGIYGTHVYVVNKELKDKLHKLIK